MQLFKFSDSIIPILHIDDKELINLLYGVNSWEDSLNYIKKYKKNIYLTEINRIIILSWELFYYEYKLNLDKIIEIYDLYIEINNIKIKNIDTKKIIYDLKNQNLKKNKIHKYLLDKINK